MLIIKLKNMYTAKDCNLKYIKLETDADNNEKANSFYVKNGFMLTETYVTKQKRKMNE